MTKEIIEVKIENGDIKEGEVVFSFESNGDNFIIYSIEDIAYGAKIHEDGSLSKVYNDEWKLLEQMFNEYIENNHEYK